MVDGADSVVSAIRPFRVSQRPIAPGEATSSAGDRRPSFDQAAHRVGEWLGNHVGIPIEVSPIDGGREWCLRRLDGSTEPLLVRLTGRALSLTWDRLVSSLQSLAEDVKNGPPDPPGYYLVGEDGLSVRGMIRFAWDACGQDIRCFVCSRLSTGAGDAECRQWRVSVDHVDRGEIPGAGLDDDRDTIQRMALEHLRSTKGIRTPPASWCWSILDADGAEWWGRLDVVAAGAEINLVHASTRRVRRLPWTPGLRTPTPAELRALLSRIRNS
jgi:hypothetical protein